MTGSQKMQETMRKQFVQGFDAGAAKAVQEKRDETAKVETLRALSLLNFHHMVYYRVARKSYDDKIEWSDPKILTDLNAVDLMNDTSIEDFVITFKPDFS